MPVIANLLDGVRGLRARPPDSPLSLDGFMGGHDLAAVLQGGLPTHAGPVVSLETSMRLAAVYACAELVSTLLGSLPIQVVREVGDSKSKIKDPAHYWLWGRPNPEVGRAMLWSLLGNHFALAGNAYIYVEETRPRSRQPMHLWPIHPDRVRVGRDPKTGTKVYQLDGGQSPPMLDWSGGGELLHVHGLSLDGLRGLSRIAQARTMLGTGLAAEEYAARMFKDSDSPPGYISVEQDLTPEQAHQLAEAWHLYRSGLSRAHRTAVLDNKAKYEKVQLSAEDTQLLELQKVNRGFITSLFGVPPHMIGDVERSTSWGTGIEEQNRGFVSFHFIPKYVKPFEEQVGQLLPADCFARWNMDSLLRGDTLKRMQSHEVAIRAHIYAPNEARGFEDLEPYPGGDEFPVLQGQAAPPAQTEPETQPEPATP